MTEDNQYTPPPGVLVPDSAAPAVPVPPPPPGFPAPNFSPTLPANGFATAAIALTGAYTLFAIFSALTVSSTVERTKEALENKETATGGLDTVLSAVSSLVGITAFVFLALWMARIRSNRTALGDTPGGPPSVEWWGWFIPIANFVLPLLGMRAISRKAVGWGLLLAWWLPFCLVWLIGPITASATFRAIDFSTGELSNPDALDSMIPLTYASATALVVAWVFLVVIIRRTTARHIEVAKATAS